MDNEKILEAILQEIKSFKMETNKRFDHITEDLQTVKDRTLKLEVTIENETNRNINLLMEAQSLNVEKLKEISQKVDKIDGIETDVSAIKAAVVHHREEIEKIKCKIG